MSLFLKLIWTHLCLLLVLGEGSTQGLDDSKLTVKAKCPFNFTQLSKRFIFLNFDGSNSFLFVDATKTYYFKAKDSEIKNIPCIQAIPQNILRSIIWRKGLKGNVRFFSVDYRSISTNEISIIKEILNEINA